MISNRKELLEAVEEAGRLIQEIHDYRAEHPGPDSEIALRFPRGFIKTAAGHREKLGFVTNATLRKNLSYAMMTHDVLRWMVTRTDISGQAKEMLIKEAICIVGSVCESITIVPGKNGLGRNRSLKSRCDNLVAAGVIGEALRDEICWVWEVRCREHLADVPFAEWSHYGVKDWKRSVTAYKDLRDRLRAWLI